MWIKVHLSHKGQVQLARAQADTLGLILEIVDESSKDRPAVKESPIIDPVVKGSPIVDDDVMNYDDAFVDHVLAMGL